MKNYWNHRDAETEMLLAAAFFNLSVRDMARSSAMP